MKDFAQRIVRWQRVSGRHDLPWQRDGDPYRRWISEVMLQQTQVSVVIPYYERFMARFPSVAALAAADEDEVLKYWEGLGYYSRGRNLLKAAREVCERMGGRMPSDYERLVSLPGIGPSTAGAVSAFASGERRVMADGNAKRVIARVFAIAGAVGEGAFEREVVKLAETLLPESEAMPAYTQGLMDMGATVCTKRSPKCGKCPLAEGCRAHALGCEEAYPAPKRAIVKRVVRVELVFVRTASGLWLVRRTEPGIWRGLWMPPAEMCDAQAASEPVRGFARLEEQLGLGKSSASAAATHELTHRKLLIEGRLYEEADEAALERGGCLAFASESLPALPSPVSRLYEKLVEEARLREALSGGLQLV